MKRLFFVLTVLLSLLILAGCQSKTIQSFPENHAGNSQDHLTTDCPLPTGHPSGKVQREYVFCNGSRYVFSLSAAASTVPDRAVFLGEISKVDNDALPDEEIEASNLNLGDKVYAVDEKIVIEQDTGLSWFIKDE